jgi:hypothetical protein
VERRVAAILAADVGFSALMKRDEEGAYARIAALPREVIEPRIKMKSSILRGLQQRRPPEANALSAFKIGDRVQLSSLGRSRSPKLAERSGSVVGLARNSQSVRVLFDGRKTPALLHLSYVQSIAAATAG